MTSRHALALALLALALLAVLALLALLALWSKVDHFVHNWGSKWIHQADDSTKDLFGNFTRILTPISLALRALMVTCTWFKTRLKSDH